MHMYMTQNEIVDRYIRRGTSITIPAELNAVSVDQIRETLTDAGVELPEVKKIKQQRIACCYDALDDIEQRIKEHTQEHKAKDHGLYIELKVGSNKPTQLQKKWLSNLNEQGYLAVVCYGWQQAAEQLINYLELETVAGGIKNIDNGAAQGGLMSAT